MSILLFEPTLAAASALIGLLRQIQPEARGTTDFGEARRLALAANPIIVALPENASSAVEFIRHVRETQTGYTYIIVATSTSTEEPLRLAYEAGCDADLRLPISPELLSARLLAADRLLGRLRPRKNLRAISSNTPSAARPVEPQPPTNPHQSAVRAAPVPTSMVDVVVRASAWRRMPAELQQVLSGFLSVDVAASFASDDLDASIVRGIRLTNAGHELEVRIVLVTDSGSARRLATHLFGNASNELEGDMIGEFSNIAMGALKAAFAREAIPFSGNLPEVLSREKLGSFIGPTARSEVFSLCALDARIDVHVGVLSRKNVLVGTTALKEGMVLAKDVFNARGMLLLTAGTRLSATAAQRLRQALVNTQAVEVAWRAS
ncbi:MAG: hypothetical protein U0271_13550 [Polyangiaceae bacterium]